MYIQIRIGKLRYYITDLRLRIRQNRDNHGNTEKKRWLNEVKKPLLQERGNRCEMCGCKEELYYHHILPYSDFPELEYEKRNILLLCAKCHKEIHCNPFLQGEMIKEKASELCVDYKAVYAKRRFGKGVKMAKIPFAKLVIKR